MVEHAIDLLVADARVKTHLEVPRRSQLDAKVLPTARAVVHPMELHNVDIVVGKENPMNKLTLSLLTLLLVVAAASPASAQTTINTDGDVEAQGFIGDGSQVTEVDAQLLDGMDSSDFAQDADLMSAEAMLVALQAQVNALGLALVQRTGQTTCYDRQRVVEHIGQPAEYEPGGETRA